MIYNLLENSVQHGEGDIEINANSSEEGFVFEVYDGGNVDWDELMPGTGEFEDYESVGTYLSDIVAKNNGYTIENLEKGNYRVEID